MDFNQYQFVLVLWILNIRMYRFVSVKLTMLIIESGV